MAVTFAKLEKDFAEIVGDIVYATMTTVDEMGRPRSRVLIAVWELAADGPVGWLATFRTPVKAAHLAGNPHTTFSYWSAAQNTVAVDAVAEWVDDPDVKQHVWDLYRAGSPPRVGYDPGAYWRGPGDPKFQVLRLEPYRVQVLLGQELVAGRPARIWRAQNAVGATEARS